MAERPRADLELDGLSRPGIDPHVVDDPDRVAGRRIDKEALGLGKARLRIEVESTSAHDDEQRTVVIDDRDELISTDVDRSARVADPPELHFVLGYFGTKYGHKRSTGNQPACENRTRQVVSVAWAASHGTSIDGRPAPLPVRRGLPRAISVPTAARREYSGRRRSSAEAEPHLCVVADPMRRPNPSGASGGFHPWQARSSAGKLSAIVSLFWRVFLFNAAVFVVGTIVLALSPATVSFPVQVTEAIVLVVGLTAMLLLNLALVRLSFSPLERLTSLMRRVDLLAPEQRLDASGPTEVRELGRVFNEMLERLEDERRESARRALAAQESERERVAHELHDEVGQMLTAVVLQLNDLAARVAPELREEVLRAQEAARRGLDEVRRVARQLRPEALDHLGLVSALTALTRRFAEQTHITVRRRIDPLPSLTAEVELVLYRVVQESLTNVARHAHASSIEVRLTQTQSGIELRVRDNGHGLDGASGNGYGIRGMRERAMLLGGELVVANRDGGGVEVCLTLPLESRE